MRCLILGGTGMLGHQLLRSWQARHEVRVTIRSSLAKAQPLGLFDRENTYDEIDVRDASLVADVLDDYRPDVVINAIGVVKQRKECEDPLTTIEINSLLPHRLQVQCEDVGARFIHFSTDCVFSGSRGNYSEDDTPDATDLYGRSKLLGETKAGLTLRTSIIGLELSRQQGLVEWFLSQHGKVRGFTRAIFSGLTTAEASRALLHVIENQPNLRGTYHLAAEPITKCDLLARFSQLLDRTDVTLVPDAQLQCDRSLDGSRFAAVTGYRPPGWDQMLAELAAEVRARDVKHRAA